MSKVAVYHILIGTVMSLRGANTIRCYKGFGDGVSEVDCGSDVQFCMTMLTHFSKGDVITTRYDCDKATEDGLPGEAWEKHFSDFFRRKCNCAGDLCNQPGTKCTETPVFTKSCWFATSNQPQLPQNAVKRKCTEKQNCMKIYADGEYKWSCMYSQLQAPNCGETYDDVANLFGPGKVQVSTCCGNNCNGDQTVNKPSITTTITPNNKNGGAMSIWVAAVSPSLLVVSVTFVAVLLN